MEEALFWADQKAEEILARQRFHYLEEAMPRLDRYVVKTSASISGVLHIGRLSDTIRSESVCRALEERGSRVEFIWVAEDMDPLRKIPEGVPKEYSEYIGTPVTEIPDPWGCHGSYAEHHVGEYLEVLGEFVGRELKRYSMREEYRKGSFRPYVKKMLESLPLVLEIQNKYRQKPLGSGWSPWTPICDGCGKIITPRVLGFDEGKVLYKCQDYTFEAAVAKGCGHEGVADPLEGKGKLMWKGEWAAQWARWGVASEGAGKEYVVPGSAWWINGDIVERIYGFPMPVPIFYEHLMVDGEKMSASRGNVIYPRDWLAAAPPQLLRFFYNKKLMKTRSFSWVDLPNLYDEYDLHARVYHGREKIENEKEARHMRRLYEISQLGEIEGPLDLPFSHAALVAQIFTDEKALIGSLSRTGHYREERREDIMGRIALAKSWALKYAPQEARLNLAADIGEVKERLGPEERAFLARLADWLASEEGDAEKIQAGVYSLAKEVELPLKSAFRAIYVALTGRERGPRAGTLIASLERDWVIRRLREAGS